MPLGEPLHHLHGHFRILADHPQEGAPGDGDEIGILQGHGRVLARERFQKTALAEEITLGEFFDPVSQGLL